MNGGMDVYKAHVEEKAKNLVRHYEHMKATYWEDWDNLDKKSWQETKRIHGLSTPKTNKKDE